MSPSLELGTPVKIPAHVIEAWRGATSGDAGAVALEVKGATPEQQPYSKYDGKWAKRCGVCQNVTPSSW